jgi:hypothetical protein
MRTVAFVLSLSFVLSGCSFVQTGIDEAAGSYMPCVNRVGVSLGELVLPPRSHSDFGAIELNRRFDGVRISSSEKAKARSQFQSLNNCYKNYAKRLPSQIDGAKDIYLTAVSDYETLQVDFLSGVIDLSEYNSALRARSERLKGDLKRYETNYNSAVTRIYHQIHSGRASYEQRRLSRDIRDLEDRLDSLEAQKRNRDFQCIRSGGVPVYGGCM